MDYINIPKWKSRSDFLRPFRSSSGSHVGENIEPLFDPTAVRTDVEEPDLRKLNASLSALIDVFPHVEPEVFREMLLHINGESRLQVVTEHLLRNKAKWIKGRYRTPEKLQAQAKKRKAALANEPKQRRRESTMFEDRFRSSGYKDATMRVLYQEFSRLSHSTIRGVLAEHNHSYTRSRPTLQEVASRSWRFSLISLFSKRDVPPADTESHPSIVWLPIGDGSAQARPAVRSTGNDELDVELYDAFVRPVLTKLEREQLAADYTAALLISETEAEEVGALYECGCCCNLVTFEQIATCNQEGHCVCFECIRRAISEAVYGQSWARSIDMERATLSCISSGQCPGYVPSNLVRRAHDVTAEDYDVWVAFQRRAAGEALRRSGLSLQRCPSCDYAEIDEIPRPQLKSLASISTHVAARANWWLAISILCLLPTVLPLLFPLLALAFFAILVVQVFPPATRTVSASWTRIHRSRRTLKFTCRDPTCGATTCTRCNRPWIDQHTCFDSERTSLRTAIESAATLAIKRTCPKCNLSFVKDAGCNKLTCVCGYKMCYVCRENITEREGYRHFCEHFRPLGTGRCTQCEKCDLYANENADEKVKQAVEETTRLWRQQEGERREGAEGANPASRSDAMVEAVLGANRGLRAWERWLDAAVDALFI